MYVQFLASTFTRSFKREFRETDWPSCSFDIRQTASRSSFHSVQHWSCCKSRSLINLNCLTRLADMKTRITFAGLYSKRDEPHDKIEIYASPIPFPHLRSDHVTSLPFRLSTTPIIIPFPARYPGSGMRTSSSSGNRLPLVSIARSSES